MTASLIDMAHLAEVLALQDIGNLFYQKNWSLGTSRASYAFGLVDSTVGFL